jgi:YegS/Rv2252/BmrU family lipid kinase
LGYDAQTDPNFAQIDMTEIPDKKPEVLIIINPVSGLMNVKMMKRIIKEHFKKAGWISHIYLTEKDTEYDTLIKFFIEKGIDMVVAAGGDGTVASVAAGMVNSSVPLGIIPSGTWNAISRHLMLPFLPMRALALMTGKHQVRYLDLMSVGDSLHAMNLGVGLSARVIKTASREKKRKLGNLAYYGGLIKQVFGIKLTRYSIEADDKTYRGKALEIMVANYGVVGLNLIESLLQVHPDDGKADVLIFKPRTILDFPAMFWQALIRRQKHAPKFQQLRASRTIKIDTTPPMDVQADGEMIGKTPVTVRVLPRCVGVIVPHSN